VRVGRLPEGIAIDPATHHIFVTSSFVDNNAPSAVSVIDERTNTIDFTITVGVGPEGVAIDPLTDAAYVANNQSGTISVLTPF
jgi:YVTN family beta-propeller protein